MPLSSAYSLLRERSLHFLSVTLFSIVLVVMEGEWPRLDHAVPHIDLYYRSLSGAVL